MAEPTKAELIEHAQLLGLTVEDSMTKAEIQALIEEAQGPQGNPSPEEMAPGQAPAAPAAPGALVCAICGAPATRMSSSTAYSPAYYCANHGNDEPLKDISG